MDAVQLCSPSEHPYLVTVVMQVDIPAREGVSFHRTKRKRDGMSALGELERKLASEDIQALTDSIQHVFWCRQCKRHSRPVLRQNRLGRIDDNHEPGGGHRTIEAKSQGENAKKRQPGGIAAAPILPHVRSLQQGLCVDPLSFPPNLILQSQILGDDTQYSLSTQEIIVCTQHCKGMLWVLRDVNGVSIVLPATSPFASIAIFALLVRISS